MEYIQCLLLLLVANGAPVITRYILHDHLNFPVDAGLCFFDQRPLFGKAKTIRGILSSIILTSIFAELMGISYTTGILIGIWAMTGDLLASFVKRRMDIATSGKALGLDQIPESLFPVMAVKSEFHYNWPEILMLVVTFIILELLLSKILYILHIRKQPY